jgi:imidazole glycerol-phosphate synthase subunit HisH
MIAIIDFGISNLKSVYNALDFLGVDALITNKKSEIARAERIILPGVGTFSHGISNLKEYGLIDVLNHEVIENRKPFLGICLGMQMLADNGSEGGETNGLGWIKGEVKKFDFTNLKIPHLGWDNIEIVQKSHLFKDLNNASDFYFVHSYYFQAAVKDEIVALCDYGISFPASLQKNNIFATQFHPEKSQNNGMKILENFLSWKP